MRIRLLLAVSSLLLPVQASAATLYGADNSTTLWEIDATTGAATAVGISNFSLSSLAAAPDGTLWGIGSPTTGGGFRLVTIDPTTAQATEVTTSLGSLGRGFTDMTIGAGGEVYVGYNRHGGRGSGNGYYEISVVDGSIGSFIYGAGGGNPAATLPSGALLGLQYSALLSVLAAPSGAVTNLGDVTGDVPCPAPASFSVSPYRTMAVDPSSGASPIAFTLHNGSHLCRIDVNAGTIASVGPLDTGAVSFMSGIAVVVPEPSLFALMLLGGVAYSARRR